MKHPSTPAIPARASWIIIVLSTLLIFGVGARDRQAPLHDELVGAFDVELGARRVVGLDVALARQEADAAEGETEGTLISTTRDRLDTELEALDTAADAPATMRRLAVLYAWLGRDDLDDAHLTHATDLLEATLTERAAREDGVDHPEEVATAIAEADRLDRLMLEILRDARPVSDAEALELQAGLRWFGDLFVAAQRDTDDALRQRIERAARRTYRLSGLMTRLAILIFFGSIAAWWARLYRQEPLVPPMHADLLTDAGDPIYLEAFAVYLGVQVLLMGVSWLLPLPTMVAGIGIVVTSLLAVLWPFLRGVGWRHYRQVVGFTMGEGFWREVTAGLRGYLLTLPLVAAGLLLAWGMQELWSLVGPEGSGASHPAALSVAFGGWPERIMMLVLAAGLAPLFEELLFRGLLFGHLRTRYSFGVAALLMSLIFAVLHPQGLMALPALTCLSIGFAAIRQERGSLVASMTAHAVHNGVLMISLMVMFI